MFALVSTSARAGEVVSQTESDPYPGIHLVERIEASPANRIHVAYVSLCTTGVRMAATRAPSALQTPGSWAADVGVQLATNGDFFVAGPQVYGDAVGEGVAWPLAQTGLPQTDGWYYQHYGWIAFGPDWVEFDHTGRTKTEDAARFGIALGWKPGEVAMDHRSDTIALVSGFPELVIEGQTYTCDSPTADTCFPDRSDMRDRNPRTAMGLTEDRATFLLVTVDGRDPGTSEGMYGAELAALMAELGAWEAFNLDGGGSTAMWLQGAGYLNAPSDGSARSVANHWGVHAGGDAAPGHCFVPGGCAAIALPDAVDEIYGDVSPGSDGHDEIIALADGGVVLSCSDEPRAMYCPGCGLDRAAAAALLVGATATPLEPVPMVASFVDVPASDPRFATIEAAYAAGLIEGCSASAFCPDAAVTRGDLAALVRFAADLPLDAGDAPGFGDVASDDPRRGDIASLQAHCVAEPCGVDAFCPDQPASRASAAVFVARAFGLVAGAPCDPASADTSGGGDTGSGSPDATAGDGSGTGAVASETSAGTPGQAAADAGGCGCTHGAGPRSAWPLLSIAFARRRVRRRCYDRAG